MNFHPPDNLTILILMKNRNIAIVLILFTSACGKDEPEPVLQTNACNPTYVSEIKAIINEKCATSGCHDNNSTIASYTSYTPLKERTDNGRLYSYLFDLKIMPPASSMQLSGEEKELIKCWLDNGAPEN